MQHHDDRDHEHHHEHDEAASLTLDDARAMIADLEEQWGTLRDPGMRAASSEIWEVSAALQLLYHDEENGKISQPAFQLENARLDGQYNALVARPGYKRVEALLDHCTAVEQELEDALTDAEEAVKAARERRDHKVDALEEHARAIEFQFETARRINNEGHAWLAEYRPPSAPGAHRAQVVPMRMPVPVRDAAVHQHIRKHPLVRRQLAVEAVHPGLRVHQYRERRGQTRAPSNLTAVHSAEEAEQALGKAPLGELSLRQGLRYFGRAY